MNIVLTVGSLHYDIMVEAETLPRRDETAIGSKWYPKFGGKGGNQAVAVAKAGAPSRMVGAIGNDEFGRFLRHQLSKSSVDDRFVATIPGAASGMSVAIQDKAGDYAATIVSGANQRIDPDALAADGVWDDVGLLILQNEVPETVNIAAARQARAHGLPTVLNAAPARALSTDFSALVDILVVNSVEAEMMGTCAVHDLATALVAARDLSSKFKTVIVTVGSAGLAACASTGETFSIPAEKVQVVSSHGAGDAFIGTLAARLAAGDDIPTACKAASLAAARHVAGQ